MAFERVEDPRRPRLGLPWLHDQLAAALQSFVPFIRSTDEFAGIVLDKWLTLIHMLTELVSGLGTPGGAESLLLPRGISDNLRHARLDAPVQKMRHQHLANRIRTSLAPEIADGRITLKTATSRGQSIVEMFTGGPAPRFG